MKLLLNCYITKLIEVRVFIVNKILKYLKNLDSEYCKLGEKITFAHITLSSSCLYMYNHIKL